VSQKWLKTIAKDAQEKTNLKQPTKKIKFRIYILNVPFFGTFFLPEIIGQ